MDRKFEQGIGRVKALQFTAIAERARCEKVRRILDAHRIQGEAATHDPEISRLISEVSREMHAEQGLDIPARRRIGDFGETHTAQAIAVDGTIL